MKNILMFICVLFSTLTFGQVSNYNQFPSMQPTHILDDKSNNISFAFSMRTVASDYNGPLVKLRRTSDNSLQDFEAGDNDILDVLAINAWRGTSDVYMHTWYDQSGLSRNAVQTTTNKQPRFYPDATKPYFQGDGNNDFLAVDTPNGIQDVTNNGNQGTVLTLLKATRKNQHVFGVLTGVDRWSAHVNWSNANTYFDPGICCNNPRNFNNASNENNWEQYTFIKTSTHAISRSGGTERFNGTHTTGRCTRTEDFGIGWATGNGSSNYSNVSFIELVMYSTNISDFQEIEENALTFWNL